MGTAIFLNNTPSYTQDSFDGGDADGGNGFWAFFTWRSDVVGHPESDTVLSCKCCAALVFLEQNKGCRISLAVRCLSVPCWGRGNQSIYLHRSGPLLENGLDRPKNRYGRYGFPSFYSISISTVGVERARICLWRFSFLALWVVVVDISHFPCWGASGHHRSPVPPPTKESRYTIIGASAFICGSSRCHI